ncbi:NINE protein [Clostridium polyendosporum]|nr:TM2 domain-containing protein [Clostridium polyendosporum]
MSFFLCLFLGVLGIHKFYEGRIFFGILYLCTGGILGIGVVLFKPNPYYP